MIPLLKLELRRQGPIALKMALFTAVICAVFYAAGKRAPTDLLAAVLGSGLGAVLIVPMGISRDKLEGTLDFICGLPVEPRAIAASRFCAAAVFAAPWAAGVAGTSVALPATAHVNFLAAGVLTWVALLMFGVCVVAAFACWDLETLLGAPLIVLVGVFVLVPRVLRAWFPHLTPDAALHFLQQPSALLVVALCLVAAGSFASTVAFEMTARAFANYRADPARR